MAKVIDASSGLVQIGVNESSGLPDQIILPGGRALDLHQSSSNGRLKTLVIGTSFATLGAVAGTASVPQQSPRSFWSVANFLAGGVLEFPETTAIAQVTNTHGGTSRNSEYGFSGGTSTQILADLDTYLLPALLSNRVIYDVCWLSIFENDQASGLTDAQSISNLKGVMAWVKARYPDIKFIINTGAPSSFINTNVEISYKKSVDRQVLEMDNGSTIRCIKTGVDYIGPDGIGPAVVTVNGTISGTTMTVNSIVNNPTGIKLQTGMQVGDNAHAITSVPDFDGGPGVYGVTTGLTESGNFNIFAYTDGDSATDLGGIHPNELACSLIARQALPIIKSFGASNRSQYLSVTQTPGFKGSTAVSGTGIASGSTRPDNVSITGAAGTVLVEALNPGCRLTYSAIADSGTPQDLAWLTLANAYAIPRGVDAYVHNLEIKIVSGSEYVQNLQVFNRQTDNGSQVANTAWWKNGSGASSGATGSEWRDGDIISFKSPIIRSLGAGSLITALTHYFHIFAKARTPIDATIVVELVDQYFELVEDGAEIATLTAGTVTIADSRIRSGSKVQAWRVIDGGTVGALKETARVAGTSVTIGSFDAAGSANAADTSQIRYRIEN